MTVNQPKSDDLFSQKSVKSALRAWKKPKKLGEHDLAKLDIVDARRREAGYADTPDGYGMALRGELREAIESLRPDGEEPTPLTRDWGGHVILTERFVHRRKAIAIQETRGIPRKTYGNWQNNALDDLANILREKELEFKRMQEEAPETVIKPPFMAPPLPPYALIGRDQVLENLKRRLLVGDSLALFALNGLPGVGKTTLALTLAHDSQVREHFEDGVLWVGLGRQPDLLSLLSIWGVALGVPAHEMAKFATIDERAKVIHAAIGTRKILLVIDDAWQINDALAFKLGGPNCAHLLTTRLPDLAWDFAHEGARAVHELNEAESLALLSQFVPQLVIAHPEEARNLVKAVGGLPLALILMARYLQKSIRLGKSESLSDLLVQLEQATMRLSLSKPLSPLEKQPSLPYGVPLSLLASIEISDRALDEPARQMLRALSAFAAKPNSFSKEAALAVANKPAQTLKTLTDSGLLEISGPNRYTMHQAIADYARLKNPEPEPSYRRAAAYFADFAQQNGDSNGYHLLDADWQNVSHFLQWAVENQQWQTLVEGVQGLTRINLGVVGFMDARGHWAQAKSLLESALEGAKALGNPLLEASILTKLGAFAFRQSDFKAAKAYLQPSLSILEPRPFSLEVTLHRTHLYEFMSRLEMQRDLEAARKWVERGLTELDALPVKTESATHQTGYFYVLLATLKGRTGQFPPAISDAQKGLALLPPSPTSARISALITLGTIFSLQGEIDKSIEYQKQGIQIAKELGDFRRLAALWLNMGLDEGDRGNLSVAVINFQKALKVYQKINSVEGPVRAHNNLGMIYIVLGIDKQAFKHLSTAIQLAQNYELRGREAFAQTHLASLLIHQGKLAEAGSALMIAHEICLRLKLADLLLAVLYWQAEMARLKREYNQALELVDKLMQAAKESRYILAKGMGWSVKGKILDGMRLFDEAEAAHQTSLQILASQSPYDLAQSKLALGQHYMMRDGHLSDRAKRWLAEALAIFERLGSKREIRTTRALLDH